MSGRPPAAPAHTPCSTYRLQFHRDFTFRDAQRIVPYLRDLGVGDCYCSPYVMARPGSRHGYDIIDHTRLNPELGDEADYRRFVTELRAHGLRQVLDFVPNHMGIDPRSNRWWRDVLENGPSSVYGRFFDIDWTPVKAELSGKVLLPILGDQYGSVLDRGELKLGFGDGALHLDYYDHRLPINPKPSTAVYGWNIDTLRDELTEDDADLRELLSVITQLDNLPDYRETDPERIAERHRERQVAQARLARLTARSSRIRQHIEEGVRRFNGETGRPESFDLLHDLLEDQAYRLAYWRTAAHEINYRRFFDINDLAGIRMENPEVFAETHALVSRLIADGSIAGLRIDHPDGLYDPAEYFRRVQTMAEGALADDRAHSRIDGTEVARPLYLLAEKILSSGECLPPDWAIHGTTGYNFLNELNGLFVDGSNARALRRTYRRVTRQMLAYDDVVYQCKKLITRTSLASELNVLAHALNQISEGNRRSRDFTLNSLREALGEVVACFPVYRTYVTANGWTPSDRRVIETAVRRARRRNPALEPSAWDFLREVLLPREPGQPGEDTRDDAEAGLERRVSYTPPDAEEHRKRLAFAMHFQQYTAPVQAKGVEDTAFYRYNLLLSLNEVGGEPARFGRTAAEMHEANRARLERWPLEMTATATHDTKLGEDVRARINALSELVDDWRRGLARWMRVNAANRTKVDGDPAPDRNDEYRFYQALVGTWPPETTADVPLPTQSLGAALASSSVGAELAPPLAPPPPEASALARPPDGPPPAPPARPTADYVARLRDYMIKSAKEAKIRTSWINDNEAYDAALARFVERTLTGASASRFLPAFLPLAARVAHLGMLNSLSQLALKIASPGIPDFYQGSELWDLHLVDPDNRQPVDYEHRVRLLDELRPWIDAALQSTSVRPELVEGRTQTLARYVSDLLASWPDGRIKLFLTAVGLHLRREHPDLFALGDYVPLDADLAGIPAQTFSFARRHNGNTLVVVIPRLLAKLVTLEMPLGEVWGEARLLLRDGLEGRYRNVLTGETVEPTGSGEVATLRLSAIFAHCPVALLWRV